MKKNLAGICLSKYVAFGGAMKKEQGRNTALRRQWQILIKINSSASGVSKSELALEYEVSKRTITRDISALSSCGFPIYEDYESDRLGQVFYRIDRNYKLPCLQFDIEELMDFFNLHYSVASVNPFFKYSFSRFFKKVYHSISKDMNDFFKKANQIILPDNTMQVKENEELEDLLFEIYEAISDNKKIVFSYFSLKTKSKTEKRVCVSPLALKYFQFNYYLAGYIKEKNKVYTWALNRISQLNQTTQERDEIDFDAEAYFNSGYGIYSGETSIAQIRFSAEIAPFIQERIWHEKQEFIAQNDGSAILTLPVNSLAEIKKMVLGFGKNAEVLEPVALKELILNELAEMQDLYKND
jgi:predicted DNA-binding transcriptional regulator YafY